VGLVTDAVNEIPEAFVAERRGLGLLREATLDPQLRAKVEPMFRRGLYAEAVFAAMREVEVRLREGAGMGMGDVGVDLMKRSFTDRAGAAARRSARSRIHRAIAS
jgi:hypothetical protein